MSNRVQLKGCKKNRHRAGAGNRRRAKCRKSVAEKRRLRQDTSLNESFNKQQDSFGYRDITIIE